MRKSLIIIIIILILAGAGYFAYTKGLINFDFLKKGEVAFDQVNEIKTEDYSLNSQEVVVLGGAEEGSDIELSTIKPWNENNYDYAGVYNFGYSEGENSIEINLKNNNFTAVNKSSVYNSATNQFDELKVSFNDVRIVDNKFYSKEFNGEFVNFLYEGQNRKGLRLYGYASRFSKNKDIVDEIGFYNPLIDTQIKKPEVPTPPKTTTTTTYMCEGRVKIVHEQESPSLFTRTVLANTRKNVHPCTIE